MHLGKTDLKNFRKVVAEGARGLGIVLDDDRLSLFETHASLLLEWNRKTNLTAITDPEEIAVKHFVDSIAAVPMLPKTGTLLDIGSGGGFPGLPLKIVVPELSVLLIDASRKKISFLRHAIGMLKLDGIAARHVRAEDLAKEGGGGDKFDAVVSRALADLKTFFEMARPMAGPGGVVLAYKAKPSDAEIEKARRFAESPDQTGDAWTVEVTDYRLPVLDQSRAVVSFRRR